MNTNTKKHSEYLETFIPDAYIEKFRIALQDFADKICEKQRENCADEYCLYEDIAPFERFIREAEQPKITDI
jgi:endonuclease III